MSTQLYDSILLIDAGATKTAFALIRNRQLLGTHTERGINPNYTPEAEIASVFLNYVEAHPAARDVCHIKYYGSGCASSNNASAMRRMMSRHFTHATIEVHSDLTAVCHALSPEQPSICGILGTGAATCFYDGQNVVDIAPSLGFMLGDQGSGTHLGKLLLTAYLQQTMPENLRKQLSDECGITPEKCIHRIYREPEPNRFMSSFAPFVQRHLDDPFLRELALRSFEEFFAIQKRHYATIDLLPWNLCGSVSLHFADLVKEAAVRQHCHIANIVDAPLPKLIENFTK